MVSDLDIEADPRQNTTMATKTVSSLSSSASAVASVCANYHPEDDIGTSQYYRPMAMLAGGPRAVLLPWEVLASLPLLSCVPPACGEFCAIEKVWFEGGRWGIGIKDE